MQSNSTTPRPGGDPLAPANPMQRLIDRILSTEVARRPPASLRRLRMAVSSTLSLLAITVVVALPITYLLEGLSPTFWVLCAGTAICPFNLLLPRWTRSDTLPGMVASIQSIGVIIAMSLAGGPVGAISLGWLMIAPLTAGLLAGARGAVLCGAISLAYVSVLIADSADLAPFIHNTVLWDRMSLFALTAFTAGLAWFYESARARAEQELESRHRDEKLLLEQELAIAARIQTSILPANLQVPGLDIATRMIPAPPRWAGTTTTCCRCWAAPGWALETCPGTGSTRG